MAIKMDGAANLWWGLGMTTGAVSGYAIMRSGNTVGTSLAAMGFAVIGLLVALYGYMKAKQEVTA